MSVLWFWEMVPQWHASTRHRLLLPVRENKMAALLFFFFFWQDANIGWGVWKLMTRLLFITTWWPNLEHTNLSKNATRFDLTKVSMLHLRQANFSGRSSVIFTFEWSAAHRYLRAPWEGERGYFEKMFLKAAYFQTNHSPAAEHDKWRSHSWKKYFGKFYLGYVRHKSSQLADIKQVRVMLLFRLLEANGWSLRRRQWWLNQKVKVDHVIINISLRSRGPQVKRPPGSAASTFILISRIGSYFSGC